MVGEGEECARCYSRSTNFIYGNKYDYVAVNRDKLDHRLLEHKLAEKMPREPGARIFVGDMTDMWGPWIESEWLDRLMEVIAANPQHVFQMLTKRAGGLRRYFTQRAERGCPVLPNLWLGVSVGLRKGLPRLDRLYATPAAVRFASFEPLLEDLGDIDMSRLDWAIVGAESDPHGQARPMKLAWVRKIRDQCIANKVPLWILDF
jgi:protein gp37